MTREEAIKRLEWMLSACKFTGSATIGGDDTAALDMAIEALREKPPCKIGDDVFGVSRRGWRPSVLQGEVAQIFYSDDMELCMVVKNACRGKFGETVFLTREEAEAALQQMEEA